jgi:hypothetical protein
VVITVAMHSFHAADASRSTAAMMLDQACQVLNPKHDLYDSEEERRFVGSEDNDQNLVGNITASASQAIAQRLASSR